MKRGISLGLALVFAAAAPQAAMAQECGESCTVGLMMDYLDGLGVGDASRIAFAPDHKIWVNGEPADLKSGVWTQGNGWTFRHTFADPSNGQAITHGVIRLGEDELAHVAVRIAQKGGRIAESEIMLTRKGEAGLFNPGEPRDGDPYMDIFIPEGRQQTREELIQAARGYFQTLTDGSVKTAFHPDCNRVENNVRTTNTSRGGSAGCSEGMERFVYMHSYTGLRFPVVDPARGIVTAITLVDMPVQRRTLTVRGKPVEISPERNNLPRSLYLFETFKVEDGRIRRIEATLRNGPVGTLYPFEGEAHKGPPIPPM
ncbi:hypothetical protein [Tsuneonella sp. HG222]